MPNPANGTGRIVAQGTVASSAAVIYGPIEGSNANVELRQVNFCNSSASSVTLSYGCLKSGGTVGGTGTGSLRSWPLAAAGAATSTVDATELEGIILGPGDSVWASASTGSVVEYTISAVVY